jgi:hypothetical protein
VGKVGRCNPATNDEFVKLTPLDLIGTVAPREEPPQVSVEVVMAMA